MAITKSSKTHTRSRKKPSTSSSALPRGKQVAAKTTKSAAKSKLTKKKSAAKAGLSKKKAEQLAKERQQKRLARLALKVFRIAYEANQRGEFQRL